VIVQNEGQWLLFGESEVILIASIGRLDRQRVVGNARMEMESVIFLTEGILHSLEFSLQDGFLQS
jgi:hypothetical protein